MTSDAHHDSHDEHHPEAGEHPPRGWQPSPWWAWTLGLLTAGTGLALAGGGRLADVTLGTSLSSRTCDTEPLAGLLLLLAGCALVGVSYQLARLRTPSAVLTWDPAALLVTVPIPAMLLALSIPPMLGCVSGERLAGLAFIGPALVGQGGIVVAGASTALLGTAIAASASVSWLMGDLDHEHAPPGIVDRAIADAEALQQPGLFGRFRGVDSDES